MSGERLARALSEIQACLEEQRRERDDALRQAAEAEVTIESVRTASAEREATLVDANTRLLAQVEELSTTVARMHSQIVELTRSQNNALVSRGASGHLGSVSATPGPYPRSLSSLEVTAVAGSGEGTGKSALIQSVRLSTNSEPSGTGEVFVGEDTMRMSPTLGQPRKGGPPLPQPRQSSSSSSVPTASSSTAVGAGLASMSQAAAAASSVALHTAGAESAMGGSGLVMGAPRPDVGAGSYDYDELSGMRGSVNLNAVATNTNGFTSGNNSSSKGGGSSGSPSTTRGLPAASNSNPNPPPPSLAAAAPVTSPPAMTTQAFFALLTRNVAPSNLETLMHALSVFNQGRIGKGDLLGIAEKTLMLPPGAPVKDSGLPDLVAVFKKIVLRM